MIKKYYGMAWTQSISILGKSRHWPMLQPARNKGGRYVRNFQIPQIEPKYFKPGEPVSGSVEFGDMHSTRMFKWDAQSMNTRGFLRFQKEYIPPVDAEDKVKVIAKSLIPELVSGSRQAIDEYSLSDLTIKFTLLSQLHSEFSHSVPNSMLYMMNNIGDVVDFYCTKVKTTTPYDELVRSKDTLPPNLHVQKEPVRFHPETDTMFGGMSAFPKSSTIVTGLRSKKKYKGYEAKKTWP